MTFFAKVQDNTFSGKYKKFLVFPAIKRNYFHFENFNFSDKLEKFFQESLRNFSWSVKNWFLDKNSFLGGGCSDRARISVFERI